MHHLDQEDDYPLSNRLLLCEPFDFRMLIACVKCGKFDIKKFTVYFREFEPSVDVKPEF